MFFDCKSKKARRLGKRELLEILVEASETNAEDIERILKLLNGQGDTVKDVLRGLNDLRTKMEELRQTVKDLRVLSVTRPNADPPATQEQVRLEWMFGKDGKEE